MKGFLGFVEGRLKISLPTVWQTSLLEMRAYGPRHVHIVSFKHWPYHTTEAGLRAPRNVSAAQLDRGLYVIAGGTFYVPASLVPKRKSDQAISALIDEETACVAFHDTFGYSYELQCFDSQTDELRWTNTVFGGWDGGVTGSGYKHRVTMRKKDGKLYVFGACLYGAYLNVFAIDDGKALCRFTMQE